MFEPGFDPQYESTRVRDTKTFQRKLYAKRIMSRIVGEIYVGKRVKLAYFQEWLDRLSIPQGAQVLEVGSGDGLFSFTAARQMPGAIVTGMELNAIEAEACGEVARREGFSNLEFKRGLLSDFSWVNRFDLIFCLDVLEHIQDDHAALREMHAALKPGGSLLVHVPNRNYMEVDGTVHTVADADAWRINPGHVRHGYTPDELAQKISGAGFSVEAVKQTQGYPIAKAHRLYHRVESFLPGRIVILPIIDWWIRKDRKHPPIHGNTVWASARKN